MLVKEFVFNPVGPPFDNFLIEEDGYPWGMIHIDTFFTQKVDGVYNEIYASILAGRPFRVKMTLEIGEKL